MRTASTCPHCEGSGQMVDRRPPGVDPDGLQRREEVISVQIPAGVAEGMQLNVTGKGNAGRSGGPPGDLMVVIEEEAHPHFKRDGNHVLYDLPVSLVQAALGDQIEVPTLDGKARIKLEPGTQPGKLLRLKGKGLPAVNAYGRGDLIIFVNVFVPTSLSKDEKETLERLGRSENFKPSAEDGPQRTSFFDRMRDFFHQD
jgi:molecular chaperone DnaJ